MLELYQAIFLFFFFQAVFARRLSIYPSTDSILCTAFPIDLCVRVCERIYFEILCCASYRMVDRFLSKCTHNFIPLPSPPLPLRLSFFYSCLHFLQVFSNIHHHRANECVQNSQKHLHNLHRVQYKKFTSCSDAD